MTKKVWLYNTAVIIILITGAVLRMKFYLFAEPLWHDECSLALNLGVPFDLFFHPLKYLQMAPPLFMVLSNLLANIFGFNQYVLRFIPFLAGVLSVPAFYFLSKEIFKNKTSIIAANLLFALNYPLICYCAEFKQYSSEVLVSILCLFFLSKFNIKEVSFKTLVLYSFILAAALMFAFPAAFIIAAYVVLMFLRKDLEIVKKVIVLVLPSVLVSGIYFILAVLPDMETVKYMGEYWHNGFIGFNPMRLLVIAVKNFNYFFDPNKFVLFGLIIFITGLFVIDKEKLISLLLLMVTVIVVLMSVFSFYPLLERTCLYLLPGLILIMAAVFEKAALNKKIYSFFVILLFVLYFGRYLGHGYRADILDNERHKENARGAISEIINGYQSGDVIVYNDASKSEYLFYCRYFKFSPKSDVRITANNSKNEYFRTLETLPKNKTYWFYYPFDYSSRQMIPYLKEWSRAKEILLEREYGSSYILKIKL